jgi:DNA modification methylase
MFPEELAERVIKLFSFKGDIVLDPFNGVGTTTVVAKKKKTWETIHWYRYIRGILQES